VPPGPVCPSAIVFGVIRTQEREGTIRDPSLIGGLKASEPAASQLHRTSMGSSAQARRPVQEFKEEPCFAPFSIRMCAVKMCVRNRKWLQHLAVYGSLVGHATFESRIALNRAYRMFAKDLTSAAVRQLADHDLTVEGAPENVGLAIQYSDLAT